ncbi:predicted protein [Arabidopsis lyrata subsp. lyrata]|uniref:Predicted protein n=1 Tax=Arabidopsis lyrata subsp. lyrata TaxID=81972 RepID=D7MIF6_ARALL|nr:predicted protein [Arabidopsis lyrata subsp. lyrata]
MNPYTQSAGFMDLLTSKQENPSLHHSPFESDSPSIVTQIEEGYVHSREKNLKKTKHMETRPHGSQVEEQRQRLRMEKADRAERIKRIMQIKQN